MAVNNGNLHKLPLKSTLNLNRFENEINDWKQYVKLNSPVYGGVLSNFYEKDIALADGHKFITYDSKDRLWTKKYNTDTTNTDVYCDNNLIYSFSNETAEKENLQEDYNIIAGTRDYKVFSTEYNYAYISSHFIKKEFSFMTTDLMLVAYKELETDSVIKVDLYECDEGEKTKVKSYSFTLPNILADFFITGFVNTNGVLFFSILPYGEIDYDNLFSYQTTYAVSLLNNVSVDKYELGILDIVYEQTSTPALDPTEDDCIFIPNLLSNSPLNNVIGNVSVETGANYVINNNDHADGSLSEQTERNFLAGAFEKDFIIPSASKEDCYISNNKIYIFPGNGDNGVENEFGINYGKGDYFTEIDKNFEDISFLNDRRILITISLLKTKHNLKRITKDYSFYIVNGTSGYSFSTYLNDIITAKGITDSYNAQYYVIRSDYSGVIPLFSRAMCTYDGLGQGGTTIIDINILNGIMWQLTKEFNIRFDLSPVENKIIYDNKYASRFYGVVSGEKSATRTGGTMITERYHIGSKYNDYFCFVWYYRHEDSYGVPTVQEVHIESRHFDIREIDNNFYNVIPITDENNTTQYIKVEDYSIKGNVINFQQRTGDDYYLLQCIGNLKNYKINLNKLGITYVLGEIFAITRGITNLVNNQIQKICSYENIDGEDIIYYLDEYNKYCSIRSVEKEDCINHQIIDDFIVFQTTDYSNNNFNTIDTEDITIFNIALDWNSRNSLFFSDDCGFVFDEGIICTAYNNFLTVRKREESELVNAEETQAIMFVSAINAQFLSTNNGIGENWCSSLTGVQFLRNIPNVFLETDLYNNNGYFGFDNENVYYLTDDKTDYSHFFIDNYMSDIKPNDTSESEVKAGACYYRFSMPSANPDLIDLVGQTSYPFESNVMLNPSIFDKFIVSYYTAWFVKVNGKYYKLQQNGTTLEPVFAYEILTQGYFEGLFVINGSTYAYSDKYIMPITYNDGVINQGDPIVNIDKLQFIASTPYQAYFYSYQNRTIYSFTGDNTISKLFESNRITSIDTAYYNPATQDIWVSTNDGTLIINSDNTFIKIDLEFDYIGILKDVLYIAQEDNAKFISYNYKEDYDKLPIELETEFYGVDDFTTSINDCVYIRLVSDEEHNDFIGNVELSCETLTQISKKSETKVFHIEKSMWDKETNTILLRYQPRYQEGVGFRISLKSDFAISAICINSTPVAITNSKNNI